MNHPTAETCCAQAEPYAAQPEPSSEVIEQAIAWRVRLESGQTSADDHVACRYWRAAHPHHEQAWIRLVTLGARVKTLPAQLAHATLDNSAPARQALSRRTALKSFAILLGAGVLTVTARESTLWQPLLADYSTGVGERRTLTLADGTRVVLNTDTAIDVRFDAQQRIVTLRRGEIFIVTAPDTAPLARPFSVQTPHGSVRALGTRFLVRAQDASSLVSLFNGALDILPQHVARPVRLEAGQQLRFTVDQSSIIEAAQTDAAAWTEGVIVAKAMRLVDLVAELDRHRPGVIRCDASVADLRISGVFPLADTDSILTALHRTLPITIETHTRYWVTLSHR